MDLRGDESPGGVYPRWIGESLALAYLEHLCATLRADALCGRAAVLHHGRLRALHLTLGLALHAIGFHSDLRFSGTPFLYGSGPLPQSLLSRKEPYLSPLIS